MSKPKKTKKSIRSNMVHPNSVRNRELLRSVAKVNMRQFGEHEFVNVKGDTIVRPGVAWLFKKRGTKEDRRSVFARNWRAFIPGGKHYRKLQKQRRKSA